MSKIKVSTISGAQDVSRMNDNFKKIEQALNDGVMWRRPPKGEPNDAKENIDLNGNRIYNLPEPVEEHEPLRKKDFDPTAVNDAIVDSEAALELAKEVSEKALLRSGSVFNAEGRKISSVSAPSAMDDAANKAYVVQEISQLAVDGSGEKVVERLADNGPANGAEMVVYKVRNLSDKFADEIDLRDYITDYTDVTTVVNELADLARATGKALVCSKGPILRSSGQINLLGIPEIDIRSNIESSYQGGPGVLVGGLVNIAYSPTISFADVTNGTNPISAAVPTHPSIRVTGLRGGSFTIGRFNYLQLYADAGETTQRLTAYSDFHLKAEGTLLEVTDSGVSGGYVNTNRIYANRLIEWRINGVGYQHNHNELFGGCFEGSRVSISMQRAYSNTAYGLRFESVSDSMGVYFGLDTYSNRIYSTYNGVGNPRNTFRTLAPVTDLGRGNLVTTASAADFENQIVASISMSDTYLGNDATIIPFTKSSSGRLFSSAASSVTAVHLSGIQMAANSTVLATDFIPVRPGDVIQFGGDFEGTTARTRIFCFDSTLALLNVEGSDGPFISQAGVTLLASGAYSQAADINAANFRAAGVASILRREVAYVKAAVVNTPAVNFYNHLDISVWVQPGTRNSTRSSTKTGFVNKTFAGVPTRGFEKAGFSYVNREGRVVVCEHSLESSLVDAALAGATSVTLSYTTGLTVGDVVGVHMDTNRTHWTRVASISGSVVTLAGALPADCKAGSAFVASRWAQLGV